MEGVVKAPLSFIGDLARVLDKEYVRRIALIELDHALGPNNVIRMKAVLINPRKRQAIDADPPTIDPNHTAGIPQPGKAR